MIDVPNPRAEGQFLYVGCDSSRIGLALQKRVPDEVAGSIEKHLPDGVALLLVGGAW